MATLNVFLFAFDRPWTASDGLRNWGDWVLTGLGLVRRPDLLPPWLYSGSILNIGVIVGGARAALPALGGGPPPRLVARRRAHLLAVARAGGRAPARGGRPASRAGRRDAVRLHARGLRDPGRLPALRRRTRRD